MSPSPEGDNRCCLPERYWLQGWWKSWGSVGGIREVGRWEADLSLGPEGPGQMWDDRTSGPGSLAGPPGGDTAPGQRKREALTGTQTLPFPHQCLPTACKQKPSDMEAQETDCRAQTLRTQAQKARNRSG